jgi:hypothetical protein
LGTRGNASSRGGGQASWLDSVPGVKVAWKLDGHQKITMDAAASFRRSYSRSEPDYISLWNIDWDVQFRDIKDVYTRGHWKDSGQKHHFMRYEGQTEVQAYNDGVDWIVQEATKAAQILKPRIACSLQMSKTIRESRNWTVREVTACMRTGEVESPLGNALHALQDSFAPAHVRREEKSLTITRIFIYDDENKKPSKKGELGHSELDKSWKRDDGELSHLAKAASAASVILFQCVRAAAFATSPAEEIKALLRKRLIDVYLNEQLPRHRDSSTETA